MNEEITTKQEAKVTKAALPEFRAGDTVRVIYRIIEGDKTREQPYEGIVIARNGKGISKSFTVRKIGADSIGVERIIPLFSPNLISLTVLKKGKVRRAKLYYLRGKKGKAATRIKERVEVKVVSSK
jgi:large subunit ribosomal protein L19